jgi:hypothetical protein
MLNQCFIAIFPISEYNDRVLQRYRTKGDAQVAGVKPPRTGSH